MKKSEILRRIDHTELRPNATLDDYARLAEEAWKYGVASVCVPPNVVGFMYKQLAGKVPVCTVIGFPNGYSTLETKAWETQQAILKGASEIDMIIDIGMACYDAALGSGINSVAEEIKCIRRICCGNIILKAIIETCYLTTAQKINVCMAASDAGVDYIKTSTGFGTSGATLEDIELIRQYSHGVKIKAAGGISTIEDAKRFIHAGCDRIGSSKLVGLLAEAAGDNV